MAPILYCGRSINNTIKACTAEECMAWHAHDARTHAVVCCDPTPWHACTQAHKQTRTRACGPRRTLLHGGRVMVSLSRRETRGAPLSLSLSGPWPLLGLIIQLLLSQRSWSSVLLAELKRKKDRVPMPCRSNPSANVRRRQARSWPCLHAVSAATSSGGPPAFPPAQRWRCQPR